MVDYNIEKSSIQGIHEAATPEELNWYSLQYVLSRIPGDASWGIFSNFKPFPVEWGNRIVDAGTLHLRMNVSKDEEEKKQLEVTFNKVKKEYFQLLDQEKRNLNFPYNKNRKTIRLYGHTLEQYVQPGTGVTEQFYVRHPFCLISDISLKDAFRTSCKGGYPGFVYCGEENEHALSGFRCQGDTLQEKERYTSSVPEKIADFFGELYNKKVIFEFIPREWLIGMYLQNSKKIPGVYRWQELHISW